MIDQLYTDLIDGHRMEERDSSFLVLTGDGECIGERANFHQAVFLLRQLRAADARACRRVRREHDKFSQDLLSAGRPPRTLSGRTYA